MFLRKPEEGFPPGQNKSVIPWFKYFHTEPTKWTFLAVLLLTIAFWTALYFCYITSPSYQQFILFSSLCVIPPAFAIPLCYPLWYLLQGRRDAMRIKKLTSGGFIVRWEIPPEEARVRMNMEMVQAQAYWKKTWGGEVKQILTFSGLLFMFCYGLEIIGGLASLFSLSIPPAWLAAVLLGIAAFAIFMRTSPLWLPWARIVRGGAQVLYIGEDGIYQPGYGLLPFAEGQTRLFKVVPYASEEEGTFLGFQFVQKRLFSQSYYDYVMEYILKTPEGRTDEAVACAEKLNLSVAVASQRDPLEYDDHYPRNIWGTPIDNDNRLS